jgi:hypothetical protein
MSYAYVLDGRRPLGTRRRTVEDNIKLHTQARLCEGADWIHMAQDRVQLRAFVKTVINVRVAWRVWQLTASRIESRMFEPLFGSPIMSNGKILLSGPIDQ